MTFTVTIKFDFDDAFLRRFLNVEASCIFRNLFAVNVVDRNRSINASGRFALPRLEASLTSFRFRMICSATANHSHEKNNLNNEHDDFIFRLGLFRYHEDSHADHADEHNPE